MSNQNSDDESTGPQPKEARAAGDGRARKDTRYKPGQSGNRKGRPKGSKNYGAQLHKLYTEPVVVGTGRKRRRVPALVALQRVLLQEALMGDKRAAEMVFKNAKEIGFGEKTEMHVCVCRYNLSDEVIARLTDQTLAELIRVEDALQAEKENAKKKPH
jgi:hypothetical protein